MTLLQRRASTLLAAFACGMGLGFNLIAYDMDHRWYNAVGGVFAAVGLALVLYTAWRYW